MGMTARSPKVVGAHFYARFGYDEALRLASRNRDNRDDPQKAEFWKQVVEVLKVLQKNSLANASPCRPLDTSLLNNMPFENPASVLRQTD